jgi:uncharacterized protein (UPF0210 family)
MPGGGESLNAAAAAAILLFEVARQRAQKLKIRSITIFCNPGWPLDDRVLDQAGSFIKIARPAFEAAGFEVQTTRLATTPFPQVMPNLDANALVGWAQTLETAARQMGFDYISLGPALPEFPESYAAIPDTLGATQVTFLGGVIADRKMGISLLAARACAQVIQRTALITPDGFANLRFAALANVPHGSPFFPAAYHLGEGVCFALATEAADLAVEAFASADSLEKARRQLIESVETNASRLEAVAGQLEGQSTVKFNGIDFSLAPFPEGTLSLGVAIERLGVPAVGLHGSAAAAALIAEALDRAQFQRAGFSGLMLPVLEDAVLAQRAAEGQLDVTDLLLYSAVCGTGLDTIPLPGDTTPEALAALLLDLAALSSRLDKPLTARLMPIPGKQAGDPTGFDFAYFANSRVLSLKSRPLHGLFAREEIFRLGARNCEPG